jgi:signal transduction histidine kinase/DNA-binding response OmpR family regulator
MLSVVTEESERVIGARRLRTLRELASQLSLAKGEAAILQAVKASLDPNDKDLPFTLTYLFEADGASVRLACATGIEPGHAAAPQGFRTTEAAAPWPAAELYSTASAVRLYDLQARFPGLPSGAWSGAPGQAWLVPIIHSGLEAPAGFLVAGLNPFRPLDENYQGFVRLIAGQVAASLANARAYEQERQRAEALSELDRAKTVFFSNVSHEFRTPLTLMLGPLQDALATPERSLRGKDLEAAHRNGLRLLRLVNALLDFSRIEAGRVHASYRPTDLGARTAELASQFRSAIERGGLQLVVRCGALGESAYVDAEMWEKIVFNLLSNAFKFTHQGGIEVAVEESGADVMLRVRDTGIGIPAEEVPRLFERFHRVEGAHGRSYEGSGIGLAMVHELVRLHGGRIEVSSEPGQGTEFRVFIPTGRAHLPPDRVHPDAATTSGASQALYLEEALNWTQDAGNLPTEAVAEGEPDKDVHIVLAEDNADMRDYLQRLLGTLWNVTAVPNGLAALDVIRTQPTSLVITDVMMPALNGFGLIKALREAPATRGLPVLMLSARAGEEARIEGLEAGADDYLFKPFSARELIARVAANLKLASLRHELRSEQAAMAALFQQTPLPIAVLRGKELVFELANPAYQKVTGSRPLVGRRMLEAMPELSGQGFDELLLRVMRTGEPYIGTEVKAPMSRGGKVETTYWTFIYAPLRGIGGQYDGVVVIATEVTEQVMARERQDGLLREAAQASRAKDEFLAMLGHELRNPLAPISTALQLLRLRGEHSREYEVIARQVGHLTRLVDDLLDVSRITQGKIELRRGRVEIAEVIARAVETASPLLEQRGNRLRLTVPTQGLQVHADRDRLAQVVSNLLTNASKYSDERTPIEVFAERDGERVRIRVKDHGVGIAPDMLERVWDMFVQQPQTMERSIGGLGLGLAIVRSLVGLHGGEVSVRSAGAGKGSEFTVELPAAGLERDRSTPTGTPTKPDGVHVHHHAQTGGKRILVVDDNEDAAGMLAIALSRLGHVVKIALDAPSALLAADSFDPEVALIDIGLPVMDGYELARRLRVSSSRDPRLIAITGYGQESDRERSRAAGFSHHLVKPIDFSQLEHAISAEVLQQ